MKVMTFNIQHGLDYKNNIIDLKLFSDFIAKSGADICGLNEVRGDGADDGYTDQTGIIGSNIGFYRYFGEAVKIDQVNPYGNAILSRYPFKSAETVLIPNDDMYHETRCVIKSIFEIDGKDICILICHMGLNDHERQTAVEMIRRILDETDIPVILMGDFNAEPNEEILRPLFNRLNDTDKKSESSDHFTFASYEPKKKIDYILYRGLKCVKSTVLKEIVSDHFPIIAEFEV